jgi:uncharacterized surface protein with fasciclin (FAS1) repeats
MANIVDTAVNTGSFSTLVAAIKVADLRGCFKSQGL